ncbi:MAG TPA: hypothetical protein O0X39_00795 [Methanocorpusculum sp.]|nr:hypothetical protein [Methanocorpusculum sp.]
MSRTSSEPSSNVNFRMPTMLLQQVDDLAKSNHHERTSEINCACRHWIEIGGSAAGDKTLAAELDCLKNNMANFEEKLQKTHEEIDRLNQLIEALTEELKEERNTMLKIMDKDKNTIDMLCSNMVSYQKK